MPSTRILLVDCSRPLAEEHRLVYDTHHPPLGLLSLATFLRSSDLASHVTVEILDSTIDYGSMHELEERIRDFRPDVLGLRCLHYHTDQFREIAAFAKTLASPPLVIGGGPYASGAPELALRTCPGLDLVCVGEGELTFGEVIEAIHCRRDVRDVPGLRYLEGEKLMRTPERPLIQDLDLLPFPDWSLVDLSRYEAILGQAPILRRQAPMETSRGCPYQCTYCHELFQKQFRVRSAQHIVAELETLESLGVHDISIIDDIFNLDRQRVLDIFELVSKKNLKMRFYYPNGLRGDQMTHEVIDAMVEGGSVLFSYALESASKRVQRLVKKNLRFERFAENVHYTIEKGVMVDMFLMAGFPTETYDEAAETVDFLKQFDVVCMPYLNIVNAFPGTEMFDWFTERAREAGVAEEVFLDQRNYAGYATSQIPPSMGIRSLQAKEIASIRVKLLREYVLDRKRLEKAVAIQRKFLTEEELFRKYQSYFPKLKSIDTLLASPHVR